jgi:hypothetical protein
MIRIIQEDVFNNKYDWFKELFEAIDNTIIIKKFEIYICVKMENTIFCKNKINKIC